MKLEKKEIMEACELYKTRKISKKRLCEIYKVTFSTLNKYLKKEGITFLSKYYVNENYFDDINTEDKAYFLGLLYADGCNNQKRNAISIGLQERDKDILEIFRKKIELSKSLSFRDRKKEKGTFQNEWKLNIINRKISKRLADLGCWENKSLTLKFPNNEQVPRYLLNHFIRGIWDGDGSIGLYKRSKNNQIFCDVSLTSTEMFCVKLTSIIKELNVNTSMTIKNKNKITRQLHINSIPQALRFLDWLYKDSTIYLSRKYSKYLEIKNYYEKASK